MLGVLERSGGLPDWLECCDAASSSSALSVVSAVECTRGRLFAKNDKCRSNGRSVLSSLAAAISRLGMLIELVGCGMSAMLVGSERPSLAPCCEANELVCDSANDSSTHSVVVKAVSCRRASSLHVVDAALAESAGCAVSCEGCAEFGGVGSSAIDSTTLGCRLSPDVVCVV